MVWVDFWITGALKKISLVFFHLSIGIFEFRANDLSRHLLQIIPYTSKTVWLHDYSISYMVVGGLFNCNLLLKLSSRTFHLCMFNITTSAIEKQTKFIQDSLKCEHSLCKCIRSIPLCWRYQYRTVCVRSLCGRAHIAYPNASVFQSRNHTDMDRTYSSTIQVWPNHWGGILKEKKKIIVTKQEKGTARGPAVCICQQIFRKNDFH